MGKGEEAIPLLIKMMEYSIWTEKYRPQSFEEMVGQANIIERIAAFVDSKQIPHILFAGPAGCGKSTIALIIAKKLFGKVAGFVAAFCLLTTFHFLYYSRTGMLDVTCGFFITASLYAYYLSKERLKEARPAFLLAASGAFVGLAILSKGVVGLLPLVIILKLISSPLFKNLKSTKLPSRTFSHIFLYCIPLK